MPLYSKFKECMELAVKGNNGFALADCIFVPLLCT